VKLTLPALLMLILSLVFNGAAIANEVLPAEVSIEDTCLDEEVWVYIKHSDPWDITCTVIVNIPKHSLQADFENCPAVDTEMVGIGKKGITGFAGFHVVTIKKGLLNDSKNYTTKPPRKIKVPQNNTDTWHVKK
jgi:hypothetical protein